MIRIDLSRDELQRGGGENTALTQLFAKLKIPVDKIPRGGNGPSNSTMLIALGISGAAAFLPSLFLSQYKQYLVKTNEQEIKTIQENVAQINADIAKLTPYQRELESFEVQKKQVRERLDVIRQLLEQRGTPVNILDAIGQNLPSRTWLQNLELSMKSTGGTLVMAGNSMNNEEISDFVDKLSESVYFNDVTLQDVSGAKDGAVEVKKFNLVAHPKVRGIATAPPAPVNAAMPVVPGAPATPDPNPPAGGTPQ